MDKNILILPDRTEITSGSQGVAITSLEYSASVNSGTDIVVGSAVAAYITATIHTPENQFTVPYGTELEYVVEHDDGSRTSMGLFTTENPKNTSRNTLKLTAYDRMIWFDVDITDWVNTTDFSGWTLFDLLKELCSLVGIELVNTKIPSGDYILDNFSGDMTARKLLQYIAEAAASFARITANGTLEFSWYIKRPDISHRVTSGSKKTIVLSLNDGAILTTSDGEIYTVPVENENYYFINSLTFEAYEVQPPEKVQIRNTENDVGVVYPPDAVGSVYVVDSNPLLANLDPDRLWRVARNIWDNLQIPYVPSQVSVPAKAPIKAGDAFVVQDVNGAEFWTIAMTCNRKGQKATIKSSGAKSRESSSAINRLEFTDIAKSLYQFMTSIKGLYSRAESQDGKITILEQTAEGLEATAKNQEGEISSLKQAAYGIESTVELQGGEISTLKQTAEGLESKVGEAGKTATSYLRHDKTGLTVGDFSENSDSSNVHITPKGAEVRDGETVLSSFKKEEIKLGANSRNAIIDLCNGALQMMMSNGYFTFLGPSMDLYAFNDESRTAGRVRVSEDGSVWLESSTKLYDGGNEEVSSNFRMNPSSMELSAEEIYIRGLQTPEEDSDAANKFYVDSRFAIGGNAPAAGPLLWFNTNI